MHYDPLRHHRRSLRMRGYDYAAEGAYFVTICTRNRECTLGEIINHEMICSVAGRIAGKCWLAIPDDLSNVLLDEYQIMPNHLHGIVIISCKPVGDLINQIPPLSQSSNWSQISLDNRISLSVGRGNFSVEIDWPLMKNPKQTLGKIIRHFKAKATKMIHGASFTEFRWQSGYHDHIIRDQRELERIRKYIRNNPLCWYP